MDALRTAWMGNSGCLQKMTCPLNKLYLSMVLLLAASRICKGSSICPPGFLPHHATAGCYFVPPSSGRTRSAADQTCVDAGGDLVSINSQIENDAVQNDLGLTTYAWIGARRNPATWSWVSGDPVTWTKWPGSADQNPEMCLAINSLGDWLASTCDTVKEYVCEQDFIVSCPTGWTQNGRQCYLFNTTPASFSDAHAYCVSQGGHLAVISDTTENSVIAGLLPPGTSAWVGFQSVDSAPLFQWPDGSAMSYTNWASEHPANGSTAYRDGCVYMYIGSGPDVGTWMTTSCTTYYGNVACEAMPVSISPDRSGFSLVRRDARPSSTAIVLGRPRMRTKLLCARECLATDGCASFDVTSVDSHFVDCTLYEAIFLVADLMSVPGVDYYQIRI